MTESQRPSGEYPMYPSYGNGDASYPPPPSYQPVQPVATSPGTTVWPAPGAADAYSGGAGHGGDGLHGLAQPAPEPSAPVAGPGGRSRSSRRWPSRPRSSAAAPPP